MRPLLGLALATVAGAAFGATVKLAAAPRSTYTDTMYGFTIQAPKFPKAAAGRNAAPVIFNAPAEDSFASNVNVMVQSVKTTRKEFQELTNEQFRQLGMTIHSEKVRKVSGKEAIEWDYEKEVQGTALRFLQLAVIDSDKVILATCTARADKFEKYAPEFRASLGSLKLTAKK